LRFGGQKAENTMSPVSDDNFQEQIPWVGPPTFDMLLLIGHGHMH